MIVMIKRKTSTMRVLVADDDARVRASYKAAFSTMAQKQGGGDLSAMAAALFEDVAPADAATPAEDENADLAVTYVDQGMAGVEAVKAAQQAGDPFQLVFLDMRMPPGIDGKETARLIRQADADINIVMVTGYSDSSPSDVAKVAGPLNKLFYVVKPFEIDEILQLTRALAEKWRIERDLADANRKLVDHVSMLELANIEISASEARVRHAAFHDALTGTPNRAAFIRELAAKVAAQESGFSVAMLDLDRFKAVNDNLGHGAGDELIRLTSRALSASLPEGAHFARLGGDEFGFILATADPAEAERQCGELIEVCRQDRSIFGHSLQVGASIGFSVAIPSGERDPIDIVRRADLALYAAKHAGRGIVRAFDQSLDDSARFRLSIENGLRQAIANDELTLVFQPIVQLDTLGIVGFEALVRWDSAEHGTVSPSLFVPIAEEGQLIHELSDWVVPRALAAATEWPGQFVSINFSPRQFRRPNLLDMLIRDTEAAGLPRGRVQVEITETALFDDVDQAKQIVSDLQKAGFRIALDDFGTGYSSLFNLKNFDIDCIKIDRSFVSSLGKEANAAAIVTSISQLARTMGLWVVAEGVEDDFQHRALQISGCSHMQGYHFGMPVSAQDAKQSVMPAAAIGKRSAA